MSAATKASRTNSNFFGWSLLYKTVENVVNKKEDVLVVLLHFHLTKHNKFQCIGLGEDETISEDDEGSELLPDGWNNDKNAYALRYICNDKLYLLDAQKTKHCLIITLLNPNGKDTKCETISLIAEKLVETPSKKSDCLNLDNLVPTASDVVDRYRKELIEPFTGTKKNVEIDKNKLRVISEQNRQRQFIPQNFGFHENRNDLYPFGRFDDRPDMHSLGRNGMAEDGIRRQVERFGPYNPYNSFDII